MSLLRKPNKGCCSRTSFIVTVNARQAIDLFSGFICQTPSITKTQPSVQFYMYPYSRKTTSTTRMYFYLVVLRLRYQQPLCVCFIFSLPSNLCAHCYLFHFSCTRCLIPLTLRLFLLSNPPRDTHAGRHGWLMGEGLPAPGSSEHQNSQRAAGEEAETGMHGCRLEFES